MGSSYHKFSSSVVRQSTTSKIHVVILFVAVCTFRVLNTFLVQSYFDPDEFWQTLEPAYCHVFVNKNNYANNKFCSGLTWEWTRRSPSEYDNSNIVERSMYGPARSYLSVVPVHLYYSFLRYYAIDSSWLVSRGPMVLYAITVAAPIDMCVWYIGRWLQPDSSTLQSTTSMLLPSWCLFCSLFSWFHGYTLIRTFANSQETLFLTAAIALVSPVFLGKSGHLDTTKMSMVRPCLAFLFGGFAVVIRFTAIAAFVPLGIMLAFQENSLLSMIGYLLVPCATFGALGIIVGMVVDRIYFGFWTIPFLGNFHFNAILNRAGLYGTHPPHWYFSSGMPAIAGTLVPFLLYDFAICFLFRSRTRENYARRNLWIIVLSYLSVMSFNSHKELRYILPVLPLLCLLSAVHIRTFFYTNNGNKTDFVRTVLCCSLFAVINVIALLYLGIFHQSGPIHANRMIVQSSRELNRMHPIRTKFVVHFLTGACHSTPLYSHLHSPPLDFSDVWHLDCSPDCRADPELMCDSERFSADPEMFIQQSYFPCWNSSRFWQKTCLFMSKPKQSTPDYIVTFSKYSDVIANYFGPLGLHEIARFSHNINGVSFWSGRFVIDPDNNLKANRYRNMSFLNDWLEFSLEDVVVFGPTDLNQQCTN